MMDALLPTAFILLLTAGCCSGQNALPPGPVTGAVDGSVTFVTTVPSAEQELDSISWEFTNGTIFKVFNSIDNPAGPGFEGRITVNLSTGSLELRALTRSDTGNYTVNLKVNETTELTGQTTLNIYEKISGANIIGPTEVLIAGNNSAILSCEVASGTMISRKWLKDGQPLSPSKRTTISDDNSIVTIDPVQGTDNGQYQCKLINPVSTDAASYDLTVNFGPMNVTISGEGTAEVNTKLVLTCTAESVPSATFSWLVNGTQKSTESSYVIESTTLNDTGNYTCVASNDVTRQRSSAMHYVTVTGCCSGQNALPPGPVTGAVDGSVTFVTTVPSAEQELDSILWGLTKGTESQIIVFNSTGNFTGPGFEGRITVNRSTGSLELRALTRSDTGNYTVNLKVNETTELTGQTTLNIYEKISGANIIGPTEVLIAGNNSAILSCEVASGTMISRKWLKDGQPLSPSNRTTISDDNSTVTIEPVQGTDNGQYQCRLINPVSTDAASYDLTVNFGPMNVTISGEGTAEVNTKLLLTCTAESVPSATFSWLVNGTQKSTESSYVIESTTLNDTGNYTCVASNDVTRQRSSAMHYVTVTAPDPDIEPEPPQTLSGGAIAGIVIGTVGGAGLIGGGGFFAYKKWYL